MRPRIAVLMFPGTNCERETARAVEAAGGRADVIHWHNPPDELLQYHGIVVPGGFSYEDRVRAGAIVAQESLMSVVQTRADEGWPVLGICNGAQVLVERGMVPQSGLQDIELALAPNRVPGFYCGWTRLVVWSCPKECAFTRYLTQGQVVPMPVAHAEGRFVSSLEELEARLLERGQVVFRYCDEHGQPTERYPDNPNGSLCAAAGVSNLQGNVLALMPHPERCSWLRQLPDGSDKVNRPRSVQAWDGETPGRLIFRSMVDYAADRLAHD
jgi:phosphoribosylformylglycinamidine synthase I